MAAAAAGRHAGMAGACERRLKRSGSEEWAISAGAGARIKTMA